jgi:hypothetical protein
MQPLPIIMANFTIIMAITTPLGTGFCLRRVKSMSPDMPQAETLAILMIYANEKA